MLIRRSHSQSAHHSFSVNNAVPMGIFSANSKRMTLPNQEFENIESKIYLIRSEKVMLDFDLAELYCVPTKRLNEQVKRNPKRFPEDFMFSLTNQEFRILISQFATSSVASAWGGRRKPPLAFTEQGIAMLSSVLHSDQAVETNILIMRSFVRIRQLLSGNQEIERKLLELESKYDQKFKVVFDAIRELMALKAVPRRRIIGLAQDKGTAKSER